MPTALWVTIALAILFSLAPLTQGSPHRYSRKQFDQLVRRSGLPLPPELVVPVIHRIAWRERWTLIGGAAGIAAGLALSLVAKTPGLNAGPISIVFAMILGSLCGGVLAISTDQEPLIPGAPRFARARTTRVSDYLSSPELAASRLSPLAAAIPAISASLLLVPFASDHEGAGTLSPLAPWIAVGATFLASLSAEAIARYVIQCPQRAYSPLELAWDDICRSVALRQIALIAPITAMLSSFLSLSAVGLTVINPSVRAGAEQETLLAGFAILAISALGCTPLAVAGLSRWTDRPQHHVLTSLWPDRPAAHGSDA